MVGRGAVRLNGQRGIKGAVVHAGDDVEVEASPPLLAIEPDADFPLDVLFEDAALIVVNKPGGIPCHPLRPGERGTVMNAVVARFAETAEVGDKPIEGGLIHRLDNGTSGALMIARSADAFTILRRAIRSGAIKRKYLALVTGHLRAPLTLNAPVAHQPKNPRRMIACDASDAERLSARAALTRVQPIRRIGNLTLVEVAPATGMRHQIRVHLASIGHPIVGDTLYGGPASETLAHGRFWLHLCDVAFDSPAVGHVKVTAPIPEDLKKFIG